MCSVTSRNKAMSYTNGCISEYLAYHIFASLGFKTQETLLGTYTDPRGKEKVVMACGDFTEGDEQSKTAEIAPVYDCGSCLYPQLAAKDMGDNWTPYNKLRPVSKLKIDSQIGDRPLV